MKRSLACPSCGKGNTDHTSVLQPGTKPAPGDWTVCFYCAAVCEFGPAPDLLPRLVTSDEIAAAHEDIRATISDAVDAVRTRRLA